MGEYTKPVCRGSWALGTACGRCERCEETRPNPPMIDREELERMHEAATSGPWEIEEPMDHELWLVEAGKEAYQWRVLAGFPWPDGKGDVPRKQVQANANLLAYLRNAVPDILALTAENAALTEKVERLEEALQEIANGALPCTTALAALKGEEG